MSEASFTRIPARSAALGAGLNVHRALPARQQRTIGAWCFLDHAGPAVFTGKEGMDVGAHPHIGLQTFTWMIEGEILHRDSLGNTQVLKPGQVNLMTAGQGISHTEESMPDSHHLHAAQFWIALPPEECSRAPAFAHYPDLPRWQSSGMAVTLLVGRYEQYCSPVQVYSELQCLDVSGPQGGALKLVLEPRYEYGLLVLQGQAMLAGEQVSPDELIYLGSNLTQLAIDLAPGSRVLLLGGVPLLQSPLIWWNFVAYDWETIESARTQWEGNSQRFGTVQSYPGQRYSAPALTRSAHRNASQPT
jgi:redox-sensitive bicupin YhaK (pirin superfamily)